MNRVLQLTHLLSLSTPLLTAAAEDRLRACLRIEQHPAAANSPQPRDLYSGFEGVGRLLSGIAPWLEATHADPAESTEQQRCQALAHAAIDHQTNPASRDYGSFEALAFHRSQTLVDAAFLAHALLRAPQALAAALPERVRGQVLPLFLLTRRICPVHSNWILFSAMVEAGIQLLGGEADVVRVEYALRQFEQWYVGDGLYADGPSFAMDYYNSYVIHPMLLDVANAFPSLSSPEQRQVYLNRSQRYAEILERMIAPDGSFVPVGRSIAYRAGAFQLLAQLALQRSLPESLPPAQIRCALGAAIGRTLTAASYRNDGFLRIGLCGSQPQLGETYISTGSLYLCATAFLPLGLPAQDEFWQAADAPWTQQRIWNGDDFLADHKLDEA